MIGGELGLTDPVRLDDFLPLPLERVEILGRPRTGDPIGPLRTGRIARAAREIDHHRYAQLFGEADSLAAHFLVMLGVVPIRVQGVSVAAEGADGEALVRQSRLEGRKRGTVFEHGELAMSVSRIVARSQLDGVDFVALELLQNFIERKLGQEGGEYADSHDWIRDKAISSRGAAATLAAGWSTILRS
jgi:hypothetical protein